MYLDIFKVLVSRAIRFVLGMERDGSNCGTSFAVEEEEERNRVLMGKGRGCKLLR